MITIKTNIKQFSTSLDHIAQSLPKAVDKGLGRWAVRAHKNAMKNLSGAGLKKTNAPGGGYPVPVRTGNLRRAEDFVLPNRSKHGVTAHSGQAYLVNTAGYSRSVHEGTGNHSAFGPRSFASDAVAATRQAGLNDISTEIRKALMR